MNLTREEAIQKHRDMWNWIADKIEKEKKYVWKKDYMKAHGYDGIVSNCFCCHYAAQTIIVRTPICNRCPLLWTEEQKTYRESSALKCYCVTEGSPFNDYLDLDSDGSDMEEHARLARAIANLKEV